MKSDSTKNYKNIQIESNILSGAISSTPVNGGSNTLTLTSSDGSYIILEATSGLKLYYQAESDTNYHTIKVDYSSDTAGEKTINVKGYRKNPITNVVELIDQFDIAFNIENVYSVTLNANGGYFNEFADTYEFTYYTGDSEDLRKLDLSQYTSAYKNANDSDNPCLVNTFKEFNTNSDGSGETKSGIITINSDLTLYVIYDTTDTLEYKNTEQRLYLTDVDIFELDDGTKNFIYPGAKGSYIMNITNTTDSKITLKTLEIEENALCVEESCLNMGYIVKHYDSSTQDYKYFYHSNKDYKVIGNTHKAIIDLEDIELNPTDTIEISLLWKWVDDDANDAKIGNAVADGTIGDTYIINVSFTFDKEDKTCGV